MSKKIIFFNSNQAWGGGEKWHFNMACALKKRGHNCVLITNKNSELALKAKKEGLELIQIKVSNLSFLNLFKIVRLYLIFKKLNADNVFMNLPSDVKLCSPIAKIAGIKKVIYRRGMPKNLKKNIINKFVFRFVDIFIANSNEIRKTIIKNLPELDEKTQIIFNGVKPKESSSLNTTMMNSPFILGNLGRLVEQKGQKQIIEIANELKLQNFPFKIKIAGKGPLSDELSKLIKHKNLEQEVELVGHVDPDSFFKSIDLFIFTSHFEGSANALIESLQYSIPAIAWDISSNPEVIENNYNGILISPFDTKSFARKIIEVLSNKNQYLNFQKEAQNTINSKFNYDSKVDEIEALIC